MKNLKIILALVFILNQKGNAQQKLFKIPDTLKSKSINYIIDRMDENEDNISLDSIYAYTYLSKAKSANDYENIIKAYNTVMHKSKRETWLQYCDSMLTVATKSKDNALIGSAYLTRGIVYYAFKQEPKALDNFIIADGFLSKTNDQYLKYKTKYSIAQIKYYLGYYDEAISLLKECENYFRENEPGRPHLNTLHSLSLCYIKTKQYELARATSDLGYREAIDIMRLQIDNCLRLHAMSLFPNSTLFYEKVLNGEHIRNLKDRDGNKMSDDYLVTKIDQIFPKFKSLYKTLSGHIHFSSEHFSFNNSVENETFRMSVGDVENLTIPKR